ncbi:hypothetical protein BsWGS_26262 [Bradybaena similaris]
MSKVAAAVVVIFAVVNCIFPPTEANWFGKRGNKEDLYSILIHQAQLGSPTQAQLEGTDSALPDIEDIWRQQQAQVEGQTKTGEE